MAFPTPLASSSKSSCEILLSYFSVDRSPEFSLVPVPQLLRQALLREILIAHRTHPAINRRRPHRCEVDIRRRGIRPAVIHRGTHLDARRESVEDEPPDFRLEDRDQARVLAEVRLGPVERRREMALHRARRLFKILTRAAADHERRRAEHLFMEAAFLEKRRRVRRKDGSADLRLLSVRFRLRTSDNADAAYARELGHALLISLEDPRVKKRPRRLLRHQAAELVDEPRERLVV